MIRSPMTRRALVLFLPSIVVLTAVAALVAAAAQQIYRSDANDPQYALAVDAADRLNTGAAPKQIAGGPSVDLARSLSIHLSVYNRSGSVLASTARLDGGVPVPPLGVLRSAERGTDVLTWQPAPGVRVAAVVVPWSGGTVLAGRSLRLVEQRVSDVEGIALVGWLAGAIALAAGSVLGAWLWGRAPL